jgi:NAD(P)-dependent dehydrogenase (short-subunit alcohol dehydrogenase family)
MPRRARDDTQTREQHYERLDDRPRQRQSRQPGRQDEMIPLPDCGERTYKGSGKLTGKTAVITGGDSGIGRAVAIAFAREGANVAVAYFDEHDDARETKRWVEDAGRGCLTLPGDIGDEAFCRHVVERAVDEFGGLSLLVNNAAEQHEQESLDKIPAEQLEKTFRTNIFSMFHLTRAALRHLREGDAIINTTSVTAFRGSEHLIDYASTKGAIVAFTRSLALNLAARKIRVNAVAPGPIWTPLIPSSFDKKSVKEFGSDVPLGRAGQPAEVAPAYVFLASADASYITGQTIHANGGEIING